MPITSEPKGPKPPLPGLVKHDIMMSVNPTYTYYAHCILHTRWSDNVNHLQADLDTLCQGVNNAWDAHIMPLLQSAATHLNTTSTSLGGDGLLDQVLSTQAGGNASPVLTPQVAICISWVAPVTWRGGRPRTYLPAVPSGYQSQIGRPDITPASATTIATGAVAFMTAIQAIAGVTAVSNLGVPSYYYRGAFRPTPLFLIFTGALVHERLDSQRRRLGKERSFPVA